MKKRSSFEYKNIFKRALFFIYLSHSIVFSQKDNSEDYLKIKNLENISITQKEYKIDSLFSVKLKKTPDSLIINDLYDYAKWQFLNKNDVEKAIQKSLLCLDQINSTKQINNKTHYRILNNLGFFYHYNGNYNKAFVIQKKITQLSTINDIEKIEAYKLAGNNLSSLGDFHKAIDFYVRAIDISKKEKNENSSDYIQLCIDASINYREIGDKFHLNKAITLLKNITQQIQNNYIDINSISSITLFNLYNHLGNLYSDTIYFDFEKASFNLNKALKIAKKNNDSNQLGFIYNDLGYLYAKSQKTKAISYADKALNYLSDIKTISISYSNKALYYSTVNDKKNTLFYAQQAINTLVNHKQNNFSNTPYKYELITALVEKAKYLLKFQNNDYEITEALKGLKIADNLIDHIHFESNEVKSKLFWRRIASQIYTNATRACFLLNKPNEGFYFMEKNKALLLLEDVTLQKLKTSASIPDSIETKANELKHNIIKLVNQIDSTPNQVSKDTLNLKLISAKENYEAFILALDEYYQKFYKNQLKVNILTLEEAQNTLVNTKTAYINYILNDNYGYGLVIKKNSFTFFQIKNVKQLRKLSKSYRKLIESPLKLKSDIKSYNNLAHNIYSLLFPSSIRDSLDGQKLIIIPDYYLQNLPFEALITSKKNNYLIENNDINYAYSVSFLIENSKKKRSNKTDLIGFAPINFIYKLNSLPKTKEEIENVSKLFNSNLFVKENATYQNFFKNIKDHTIIHIASHANANDSINPWIAYYDKKIYLNELYLSQNSAELVVLSACKTGVGDIKQGEGVMSLARAFFNTGSNSVLSSLWNVNDKSSSEIIKKFYTHLKNGKTKSEALRAAKLNYLKSHKLSDLSPYYWASQILIGDYKPISSLKKEPKTYFLTIISFILLVLFDLYLKIKK